MPPCACRYRGNPRFSCWHSTVSIPADSMTYIPLHSSSTAVSFYILHVLWCTWLLFDQNKLQYVVLMEECWWPCTKRFDRKGHLCRQNPLAEDWVAIIKSHQMIPFDNLWLTTLWFYKYILTMLKIGIHKKLNCISAEETVPWGQSASSGEEDLRQLGPWFHPAETRGARQLHPGTGHTPEALSAVSIWKGARVNTHTTVS